MVYVYTYMYIYVYVYICYKKLVVIDTSSCKYSKVSYNTTESVYLFWCLQFIISMWLALWLVLYVAV